MRFFKAFNILGLLGAVIASPMAETCTAQYRKFWLDGVAPAFSDMTPGATAKFLQALPLKPTANLLLYINGAPGFVVGHDASSVRNFALLVRQAFYQVYPTSDPTSTDYINGTTHTELEIVTGVLHTIALPVNFHAGMNFNYDLNDCFIQTLQGFLTIPSAIGGQPVSIPAITKQFQDLADQAATMDPCCG